MTRRCHLEDFSQFDNTIANFETETAYFFNKVANVPAVAYMRPSEKGAGKDWLEQG